MGNSLSPSHQDPSLPQHRAACLAQDISNLLFDSANSTPSQVGLDIDLAGSKSTREAELRLDPFNAVGRVDVLDKSYLVAGSGALASNDGGGSEEVFPDLFLCQRCIRAG